MKQTVSCETEKVLNASNGIICSGDLFTTNIENNQQRGKCFLIKLALYPLNVC